MELLELMKKRYSVRAYLPKPVEEEKLAQVLEAGRVAPTAANRQPQRLYVIRGREALDKLAKAADLYGAPLAILVCADTAQAWKRSFDGKVVGDIDATIVTDHMMLAATELGLATIWETYFKPDVLREEFHLPEGVEPVNILGLGYADTEKEPPHSAHRHQDPKVRKPLSETVQYCN